MEDQRKPTYKDLALLPRRWFPLWCLDGYILREFMIKYSILLLVFVILFILSDVYRDISDFLDAKAPWKDVLLYLGFKLPGNIRFILPISMLLGCMWTMATFGKNMEITAMRASGVSLFRCGWSILLVGLIVTAVNIYFNEALVPFTEYEAGRIYDEAAEKRRNIHHLLTYRSDDHMRHWLFSTFSGSHKQENVNIKTFWNEAMIKQLLGDSSSPDFAAKLGNVLHHRSAEVLAMPPAKLQQEMRRELIGRKIDIYGASVRYDKKTGIWLFENGNYVSYDRNDETRFAASRGTSSIHAAIPYKSLMFTSKDIPESPEDILNAVKEKDDLPTAVIWDLVRRHPNMPDRVKCIYMTVFYYRLAFPWSCFLAVFLGIPLATKNERTGSLLAIITAVGVIVVYIVTAQVFLVLGKGGVINSLFAGLAPTIGFIACGAWRLLSNRN